MIFLIKSGNFKLNYPPSTSERLCRNPFWSLRATAGSVAISLFSLPYEIASVVSLPRNDITTQPPREAGFWFDFLILLR